MDDFGGLYAATAGAGIVFLIVSVLITAGGIALSVWISYTIVWRAVRRGLREYYTPAQPKRTTSYPPTGTLFDKPKGPRDW